MSLPFLTDDEQPISFAVDVQAIARCTALQPGEHHQADLVLARPQLAQQGLDPTERTVDPRIIEAGHEAVRSVSFIDAVLSMTSVMFMVQRAALRTREHRHRGVRAALLPRKLPKVAAPSLAAAPQRRFPRYRLQRLRRSLARKSGIQFAWKSGNTSSGNPPPS